MINRFLLFIFCLLLISSCSTDDSLEMSRSGEVSIRAYEVSGSDVSTRALVNEPITYQNYGSQRFYIYSVSEAEALEEYVPTSGVSGQLSPAVPGESLVWYNKTANHTFYGWTIPWGEEQYKKGANSQSIVTFVEQDYINMGITDRDQYFNCRLLERFIGAKTGPINYYSNGEIVDMNFQHLVSKIHVGPVRLISDDGTTSSNVNSKITFYQLPRTAIFDRMPEDGSAPKVIEDPLAEYGVTYSIGSPADLYVAPNQDFSKMQFSVHVETASGAKGDFFGDFRSVVFQRDGTDQPEWDNGKSPTILYAGEEMTINLTVSSGNAGTISVSIADWNVVNRGNATTYARKGLYTSSELKDMANKLGSASNMEEGAVDEIFDIYGVEEEGPDGKTERVIYVYEDLEIDGSQLPTTRDLILDGTGHTVQMKTTTHVVDIMDENGNITGTKNTTVFHVGNVRNIYITDTNGNLIFIDEDRRVWTMNPETQELEPTYIVLPELVSPYNSYYIDIEKGYYRLSGNN